MREGCLEEAEAVLCNVKGIGPTVFRHFEVLQHRSHPSQIAFGRRSGLKSRPTESGMFRPLIEG
jgi:hypothetical protein